MGYFAYKEWRRSPKGKQLRSGVFPEARPAKRIASIRAHVAKSVPGQPGKRIITTKSVAERRAAEHREKSFRCFFLCLKPFPYGLALALDECQNFSYTVLMNERQQKILAAIVELYTETAVPIGSQTLLERYDFGVSPATIRSDMAVMEEAGFLYQPHTSAGRIPTDEGYRYFVEEIMPDERLSLSDQKRLQQELLQLRAKHARLGRSTAKLLSTLSGNLAVTGAIGEDELYDFGMKSLLEKQEFQELDEMCRLVEALDTLDERFDLILSQVADGETRIFIGKENPIKEISNCSMVVAPYDSAEGKGILAIIGPKRMQYAKNKSLLEHMKKLLGSSLVIIILIS
jgi:heat-inducible transcriptional repressor